MAQDWESTFAFWATPPSATEKEKSENAERMVRKAIDQSAVLAGRNVRVFTQGSYRNHTNVRQDSDVDIAVCCEDLIHPDYHFVPGIGDADVGLVDSEYNATAFKNDLEAALRAYFGTGVTRGDKAFDVHANTYRTDADVVPCVSHRRYSRAANGSLHYDPGIAIRPDKGGQIINWPEQHYSNGVDKNQATNQNYKRLVRVMKNLRNQMASDGNAEAGPIASFLVECLVWNVDNQGFTHQSFSGDVRYILSFLAGATSTDEPCKEWGEVNELKYLFRAGQPWTRAQAYAFVNAAWNYLGF